MSNTYESVCEELDTLALTYLTKLNEYTHQWKDTSNEFQQAYLDLAHAKYTMGARTISHYSYDERMKASLQVQVDDDLNTLTTKQVNQPQKDTTINEKKGEEGLRKRHEPPKRKNSDWVQIDEKGSSHSASSDNDEIELDEKKNKKIKKNGDPLYWFGLFVSPSLRNSQAHFKTATEQLIQQVNRINELKSLEKRYHELQEEKIILQLKRTKIQEDVVATS